jgi:hypothetical protein
MKSLKLGVALAIAAAALPGTAEAASVVNPTTVTTTFDPGENNGFSIGFNDSNLANPFNEFLTFTTDVAGMLSIRVETTATSAANNVTFSNVILTGTGLGAGVSLAQVLADPNDTFIRNMISVGAGTYTLNIQGTPGTASGSFSGTVAFSSVAAVPEPGTWALMLLGFGAVGFSMRRRRSATAHLYQAA